MWRLLPFVIRGPLNITYRPWKLPRYIMPVDQMRSQRAIADAEVPKRNDMVLSCAVCLQSPAHATCQLSTGWQCVQVVTDWVRLPIQCVASTPSSASW